MTLTAAEHSLLLRRHVIDTIRAAAANDPRSLQKTLGPSEVGDECDRKIAYKLAGMPEVNWPDPWKATVGHAVHAWLAATFQAADAAAGGGRYLVEQRVDPGGPAGTSDLFIRTLDRLSHTVTDWKIVGASSLTRAKREGPKASYRVQLALYGKGMRAAGERVDWTSIVYLPQSGVLEDAVVFSAPYDEQVADAGLARLADITQLVVGYEITEGHPERLAWIPARPERLCSWCPFYAFGSTDPASGCPGDSPVAPGDRGVAA